MKTLSELKSQIKDEASENPEKFFATDVLRQKGFHRGECSNCGMYFWSADPEREVCGEPECSGGYTFINDSPTEESFSYIEAWELYRDHMEERGYTAIDRYPTIARWREDVEFTGAAIYCFQPYVVSGEADPPAKELVMPQPSLRFNDVDNVGITGRHYVMHDHISQTCFRKPEEYDQDRYFRDMFEFAVQKLKIPKEKLILHEDAWGGGGNLGPCMEFFVDGLELWNQVYMLYEQTPDGYKELDLQVLDMGMGHERITWISHGTETSYECVMPETLEKLKDRIGLEVDQEIWEKFLPHSSKLNIDEVDDIDEKWEEVAEDIGVDVEELKTEIKPAAAAYSVAEHMRALMFALADGKLPSNTGGGHNLRMVYRRAKDLVERHGWDLDLGEVAEWNARELYDLFPEPLEKIDEIKEILEVEEEKYEKSKMNARRKLEQLDENPAVEEMVRIYESHGVSPEMMEEAGIEVPEDFYTLLADEEEAVTVEEERFDVEDVEETELYYYEDEKQDQIKAEVVSVKDEWVALDRTVFYPEGGGQEPDKGVIETRDEAFKVVDVQKQDGVVLHKVIEHELEEGDSVKAKIDWKRRKQLMQHHSATHMVNGATKKLLGDHIWQAGAHKTVEKGRLDVTHYENIDRDTLDRIEEEVREMIWKDLSIDKEVLKKAEAEKKYGFRIYQGGAPPGNQVRIVKIHDEGETVDVEACGGTHLYTTGEAREFVVTGSTKVQDGVIRIQYKAGDAAEHYINEVRSRIAVLSEELGAEEPDNRREAQRELLDIFSVEPDQLKDTVESFREESEELRKKVEDMAEYLGEDIEMPETGGETLEEKARSIFEVRKEREKLLEGLESELKSHIFEKMDRRVVEEKVPTANVGLLIQIAREIAKGNQASVTLVGIEGAVSASYHDDYDADENLESYSDNVRGDETFAKAFDL